MANPALDYLGIGRIEAVPRKIVLLYDGELDAGNYMERNVTRLLGMPLEYLGFIPEYIDIGKGLPSGTLKGRYAASPAG